MTFNNFVLPSIVVIDSDKDPDDQLRTMIILYRPPDPDQTDQKCPNIRNKGDRTIRVNTLKQKKPDGGKPRSDNRGRSHLSRERQPKQSGKLFRRDSEERHKNTMSDSVSLNRHQIRERKRQKDKHGKREKGSGENLNMHEYSSEWQKLQKQKSISQDSLLLKKGRYTHKWRSEEQLDKRNSMTLNEDSDSDSYGKCILYLLILYHQHFFQMRNLLYKETIRSANGVIL